MPQRLYICVTDHLINFFDKRQFANTKQTWFLGIKIDRERSEFAAVKFVCGESAVFVGAEALPMRLHSSQTVVLLLEQVAGGRDP